MKLRLFRAAVVVAALFFSVLTSAQNTEWKKIEGANVSVNATEHDFGTQKLYSKIEYEFKIQNDNTDVFIIKNITTSCGCTTPTYSKRPVKSGKAAIVKVAYDSRRIGFFDKSINVYTNFSSDPIEFRIKGTMEEPKNDKE